MFQSKSLVGTSDCRILFIMQNNLIYQTFDNKFQINNYNFQTIFNFNILCIISISLCFEMIL